MTAKDRLPTAAVAKRAGVSRTTLLRWLREGLIEEPDRDWRGWRAWTDEEADAVSRFANRIVPHPRRAQGTLGLND